jgi:putative alpha-1,2-mannosidase
MSAWLVMSALGFYQVCPGCGVSGGATISSGTGAGKGLGAAVGTGVAGAGGEYVLTTPLFDDITLHLPARGATMQPGTT